MGRTLVVFDIGGVLVKILHTWDEILEVMGEPPHAGPKPWRQADYQPLTDYQDDSLSEADYLETLARDLNLTTARAFEAHGTMLLRDYPGALDLIQDLRQAGVFTACLSNTNDLHWRKLMSPEFHPTISALDKRFASFEIKVNKPLPEAYAAVLSAFPDVERRFFFDDHPGNVAAATALGWESHQVDPQNDPPQQMRRILTEAGVLS